MGRNGCFVTKKRCALSMPCCLEIRTTMTTNDGFLGHEPPTRAQKQKAVQYWRNAAEHERTRFANGLCYGNIRTAEHNAALYERVANEIEAELDAD